MKTGFQTNGIITINNEKMRSGCVGCAETAWKVDSVNTALLQMGAEEGGGGVVLMGNKNRATEG